MDKIYSEQKSAALLHELRTNTLDISKVQQLLDDGAHINYQSPQDNYTALMLAVTTENYEIAEFLLNKGANPLIKNHSQQIASDLAEKQTPIFNSLKNNELIFATLANDIATVKELIANGADVNFQGIGGYSGLLLAVEQSNVELVDFFLINGADQSLSLNDRRRAMDLVKDEIIYITLQQRKPLTKEDKQELLARNEINYNQLYKQARLKTIEARKNKPFDVSQLQISEYKQPASESQITELEHYFKHPIPAYLKEIFRHYNGGHPKLNQFGEFDLHHSVGYFYTLNDDKENISNIWRIIKDFGAILGPDTLPFAEHSHDSVYFLKWKDNQAKVYLLMYGDSAQMHFDEDALLTISDKTCDSFDEFLEGLYEVDWE